MQAVEARADVRLPRREFMKAFAALAAAGPLHGAENRVGLVRINSGAHAEIQGIKERFAACFLRSGDAGVPESVPQIVSRQAADGSWGDLSENAPPVRGQSNFRPFLHVHRLRKIAAAYRRETDARRRERLVPALRRGVGWWLERKPTARAAWYQEIGAPTQLAQALILAEEVFGREERAGVVALLRTAVQPDGSLVYSGKPATGQNLIWEAQLQVLAGCLLEDKAMIKRYARRAEQEMQPTRAEGLQPDYSFHQHGPQLYAGGYGQNFAEDCARLIHVLDGTRHAFQPETCEHILRYLLDGQQWMIRGRHWDFGVVGRWVAWPEGTRAESDWRTEFPGATGLAHACHDLEKKYRDARRDELSAFAARLEGRAAPEVRAPEGCRVFWCSEYVAWVRPHAFFAVRMSSRRVNGTETSATGQGLLNWHLGDGATCLMRNGREYDGIAPLWNWRRLPGVTCVHTPDEPLPRNVWGKGSEGGSDFAGGVTDGRTGIAAMELVRGGTRGRKAWFMTGRAIVCLGTGLRADQAGVPLVTGVEQCWSRTPFQTSMAAAPGSGSETAQLEGESWAWHDGVGYLFGQDSTVRVRTEDRRGHWSTVNTFIHAPEAVHGRVFDLWLEHAVDRAAEYHYVVVPGIAATEVGAFRASGEPRVLRNAGGVQAVAADGQWSVVFWQPGECELGSEGRVQVDAPCLVQLRPSEKKWTAAVGNPTHAHRKIRVTLDTTGRPARRWMREFDFSVGKRAGAPQMSELLPA